ncbi:MAG TPA: serine hydrolase domain-containing protein, partial [Gemmatimonadales bacterium]|nr:serine hydrolase domain-containing protein [Gemmatimonadales bacterium]
MAKQFTAAAIALLAADGKLGIDDDVRRWIPEVPEFGQTITLRHLLNHTSGLRDQWGLLSLAGRPPGSAVHTIPEILDLVSRQRELNFPPGSRYLYSNTGYTLLGVVVQRASGMPFAQFSTERIFRPLGMTHTQWRDDFRRVVPGRVQAYEKERGAWVLDMPFTMVHGNGGLLTTVGDLLTWNAALDAGTLGATITPALETRGKLTDGRTIDYALGLTLASHRTDVREVSHGGSTAGYRAYLARFPEQGLSVALLCNAADANPGALAHRVADLFLPAAPQVAGASGPGASAAGSGAAVPALERFQGAYRNPDTEDQLRFSVRGGQLGVVAGGAG